MPADDPFLRALAEAPEDVTAILVGLEVLERGDVLSQSEGRRSLGP